MDKLFKIAVSFLCIIFIYILVNFVIFDFFYFQESEYFWVFCLNIGIYVLFASISEASNDSISEYSKEFSILMVASWYIFYEIVVDETIVKSIGVALVIGSSSFFTLVTNKNWPYSTDEALLFRTKYDNYCNFLYFVKVVVFIGAIYFILVGEWG